MIGTKQMVGLIQKDVQASSFATHVHDVMHMQ